MNIGELFIKLGLKGTDKVKSGLGDVGKTLDDVNTNAFKVKAGIAALVYGLGRLAAFAAGNGMAMKNFADETGLSVDTLQRWQIAGIKSGVAAEEMAASIRNVQAVMGKMKSGQGAPSGWASVVAETGLDFNKVEDTYYVMQKLKDFAQRTKLPTTLANEYIQSFVGNPKVVGLLRTTKVELDKIPKSMIMTRQELEKQARLQADWDTFWRNMQMVGQRFAMTYAPGAMKAMGKAFDWALDAAKNIRKLNQEFPILEKALIGIAALLAAKFAPISATVAGLVLLLEEYKKFQKGEETFLTPSDKQSDDYAKNLSKDLKGRRQIGLWEALKAQITGQKLEDVQKQEDVQKMAPKVDIPKNGREGASINIQQDLHFQHEGTNAQQVASSVDQAIKNAFYQMPANVMVT